MKDHSESTGTYYFFLNLSEVSLLEPPLIVLRREDVTDCKFGSTVDVNTKIL